MIRAQTLLAAVAAWEAAPPDPARDAFLQRVAENAKAIAERDTTLGRAAEMAAAARMTPLLGHGGDPATLTANLAAAIRSGALAYDNPTLLTHLRLTTLDDLAIEQPRYRHGLEE